MLTRFSLFVKAQEGLAAIEFALIAPVMIMMFYGAVELSTAVDCNSRVDHVAYTVADLVAQATTVSTTDTSNIFNCAGAILYPYTSANAKITVSSLTYDTTGKVTVAWSDPLNTSALTSPPANFPTGLMSKDSSGNIIAGSVIYSEVTYTYSPPVSYFLGGSITLKNSFYAKPRRSTSVAHS